MERFVNKATNTSTGNANGKGTVNGNGNSSHAELHAPIVPAQLSTGGWSVFQADFVNKLSRSHKVEGVWALGTVLAITLRDDTGGGGYQSDASQVVHRALMDTRDGWAVHSRVLGNVLYVMTGLTTSLERVVGLEGRVWEALRG